MKMDKVLETLKEDYALRASLKRKHLKVQDELEDEIDDLEQSLITSKIIPELEQYAKTLLNDLECEVYIAIKKDTNGDVEVNDELSCTTLQAQESTNSTQIKIPVINEDASRWNYPIKEQFHSFVSREKTESTARNYTSTLDNPVRQWINKEVDEHADSVFSYTSSEDVQLCIDMLNASAEYVAENNRKHHSMSAALNQYLKFIQEWEIEHKD